MQTYVVDGHDFSTLEEFARHFSLRLLAGHQWNGNLDAFNGILRGGFGTPDEGFRIRWLNSDRSREALGYPETVRQLRDRLGKCHPANEPAVALELAAAEQGQGPTVFDWLVSILREHGSGGSEKSSQVVLELE